MRKKNRTGGITLPGLECTIDPQQSEECGSGTNADADQWNDRKPRNKLTLCDQLIHNKGGTYTHGEKTISSISGAGKTGQLHVK